MRTATAGLKAFLDGQQQAIIIDLLTIVTAGGSSYRWTSFNEDVTSGGNTWTAGGTGTAPLVGRGRSRCTMGLEPSDLEVRLLCGSSAQVGGVPITEAALAGTLDGAEVTLERAYLSAPGTVEGTLLSFQGQVSDVQVSSGTVSLSARSVLGFANQVLPRNVYRELCTHSVFDAGCGLTRGTYAYSGTVTGTPTASAFASTPAVANDLYFVGGTVTFTSGALNGQSRMVRLFRNGTMLFTVDPAFPEAPAVNDTFTAYPGCDKTMGTCTIRFSNLTRYRGFPFVPTPEATQV